MNPLHRHAFPRSSRYDLDWIFSNQMGPHPLWLCEWLLERMSIARGARVLDLGCGNALTSIFLARELDAQVWAVDLWADPTANMRRIRDMGEDSRVFPLKGDAQQLNFADGFFDAIIMVDSYMYFGAAAGFLDRLARHVKANGQIGVVMPVLMRELIGGPPAHLTRKQTRGAAFWTSGCDLYRSISAWRQLWLNSDAVDLEAAETMVDGWMLWRDWERALSTAGKNTYPSDEEALDVDGGRFIGLGRLVGRLKPGPMKDT